MSDLVRHRDLPFANANMFLLFVVLVSARPACAIELNPCATSFAELLTKSLAPIKENPTTIEQRNEIVSGQMKDRIRSERNRLREFLKRDAEKTGSRKFSADAVLSTGRLTVSMRTELQSQGFQVRTVRRPQITVEVKNSKLIIPEREVLLIESGAAKGPVARELKRVEDYVALRKKDPALPESIRSIDFTTSYDPALSAALANSGHFVADQSFGTGINISTRTLLAGNSMTIEILRHELRHMQTYFDVLTGRAKYFRGALYDETVNRLISRADLEEPSHAGKYAHGFDFDELKGYLANLRTDQARIGRETADMRKQSIENSSRPAKEIRQYRRRIESLREAGLRSAKTVEVMAKTTLTNIQQAKDQLSKAALNREILASRISSFSPAMYPGLREVTFDISSYGIKGGRSLVIYIPEKIASAGARANYEYAMSYLDELERTTKDIQKQTLTRIEDLNRDAIDRLELSNKAKP